MHKVERKHELERKFEETRFFGNDLMEMESGITSLGKFSKNQNFRVDLDKPWKREIWESQKKCGGESAVRIEVFSHGGKPEHVTVSEIKEGKLFKSEFNSKLEPVAGGTAPASLVEEHRKNLKEFMKGEFFKHAMDRVRGVQAIVNVQGAERHIYLNKNIASTMLLKDGMQCKWERGEDCLIMTPLKETTISVKVQSIPSLVVTIPEDMLAIGGLKRRDLVVWVEKEGRVSPRKCEEGAPNAVKIRTYGNIVVPIPTEMAEKQKVEKGEYGIWTFDENRALWLEVGTENSRNIGIAQIWETLATFAVRIPKSIGEWPEVGEAVILEVKDGKLFIRPKQG
ncbi:hypothetical protein H0N98_02165 [Candidatus Micrarchaeota archaeon]|nr:hypothetical protein [Candidatus Micrarchaeota archaeon]